MREQDILAILQYLDCKVTTKEEIITLLEMEDYITMRGSIFENKVIEDFLDELDWNYICNHVKDWIVESDTEEED